MPASKRKRRQSDEHNRASRDGAQQQRLGGSKIVAANPGTDVNGTDDGEAEEGSWRSRALTKLADMPRDMVKYWYQRHRLFTAYDSGILLDRESWFSVTPEAIASRMAERCRCHRVLDLFCGAGGNAIQFAMTCESVVAIDIDPVKVNMARHNAAIYNVEDRITFLVGDCTEFVKDVQAASAGAARSTAESRWQGAESLNYDAVFLSPPWGGVSYSKAGSRGDQRGAAGASSSLLDESIDGIVVPPTAATTKAAASTREHERAEDEALEFAYYPLSALSPCSGKELYRLAHSISPNVAMMLPRNSDLAEIAALPSAAASSSSGEDKGIVAVEEQYLGQSFKALAIYFGQLATDWDEEGYAATAAAAAT